MICGTSRGQLLPILSAAGRIVVLSLVFAFLTACSDGLPAEFPAPDFTLKGLTDGTDIRLSEMRGSPVILYFFASW